MKKRRWICLALTAALTFGMLAGCGQMKDLSDGGEKKELQKVTLNEVAHSIFYAPMYVAIEEGYFREEGIDLTLVTGFGADKTVTAVLAGEADIGFMGSESTIYTKNGGAEDYLINFAQLTQRAGNFLVAREPIENFEWDMLKGKKVLGGRAGGMPEMVFEYILKQYNIDPTEDLSIDQSIDFGSTAAAFSGGQGDFTVEFEPHATALEQKGDGYVVASLGEESGYVPYTAFSAKKSYLEAHPDTVQAFVNALQRGMEKVSQSTPEEIAKMIASQFPETDEAVLTAIVRRYVEQDTWKTDLIFSEDAFILLQDILEEGGELVTGGERYTENGCDKGFFMKPTILISKTNAARVCQEEIFGPVVVVQKFKTVDEVIELANDSVYGLGGGVFTGSLNTAMKVSRGVQTGRVWVNTYNAIPAGAPFGGYKESGIGRETHKVMLEHYSQTKNIMINLKEGTTGLYDVK